jgi:hypothetical protein
MVVFIFFELVLFYLCIRTAHSGICYVTTGDLAYFDAAWLFAIGAIADLVLLHILNRSLGGVL